MCYIVILFLGIRGSNNCKFREEYILFCKKMKFMTFTFVMIFIVAGINTQWNLTRVYVNDLKWKPVMEFGEDWYFYYHDVTKSMGEDGFLIYLRTKYGFAGVSHVA